MTCQFIDAHRDRFGVVPICRALTQHGVPIAPRTYWARRSRPPSRRSLRDQALTEILASMYEPGEKGRRKPESRTPDIGIWITQGVLAAQAQQSFSRGALRYEV